MAGYLTVLKNNFAGTQAAEMGEDPPLTYFCRSRGTCDITSAQSRQRRRGCTTEVARELKFYVNNLAPLVAVRPPPGEWDSAVWKRSARAARGHADWRRLRPVGLLALKLLLRQLPTGAASRKKGSGTVGASWFWC